MTEWCNIAFGPMVRLDGGEVCQAYECRRPVGHDGPCECPGSIKDGYALPDLTDVAKVEAWLKS